MAADRQIEVNKKTEKRSSAQEQNEYELELGEVNARAKA
jgi:hypothetical protein